LALLRKQLLHDTIKASLRFINTELVLIWMKLDISTTLKEKQRIFKPINSIPEKFLNDVFEFDFDPQAIKYLYFINDSIKKNEQIYS
jgi:hypothetical protein